MGVVDAETIEAVLEMPLRRLTKFSRLELESERDDLVVGALERALADEALRSKLASGIATSVKRFDIGVIGAGYNDVLSKISAGKGNQR